MKKLFGISFVVITCSFYLLSCSDQNSSETKETNNEGWTEEDRLNFKIVGDSIANQAQGILLNNVQEAIKEGGLEYAVSFCNENAIEITENVSIHHKIKRLSDRNRNPNNTLETDMDKEAWKQIKEAYNKNEKHNLNYLAIEGDEVYYYKGINLAMPTCMKCHGKENEDIDAMVLSKIKEKYPKDLATGYEQGDFRGIWKVKLN